MIRIFTRRPGRADTRLTQRKSQLGFTLMELMISVGFMASLAGLISGSTFLSIRTRVETGAVADVAVETAKTTRWLVRDVHRAESTGLVDPSTGVTSATFNWDDGGPVSCTFALSGTDMTRDCGAGAQTIGKFINNLTFDRAGNLITVSYQIVPPTAPDRTEQVDLNIALGGG